MYISKEKNLVELAHRFQEAQSKGVCITPVDGICEDELDWDYWIRLAFNYAYWELTLDEDYYNRAPKEVKACWEGLWD